MHILALLNVQHLHIDGFVNMQILHIIVDSDVQNEVLYFCGGDYYDAERMPDIKKAHAG